MALALPEALRLLLIALILDAGLSWLPGLREVLRAPADFVRELAGFFDRRLNRERRSAATRFVRGFMVTVAIAALAWAVGMLAQDFARGPRGARGIEVAAILFLLAQRSAFDLARRAARDLEDGDHGRARAAIEALATAFCGGVVGVTFWYLVFDLYGLGLPGLCLYRAVHIMSARIGKRGAFGRCALILNAIGSAIPAPIAGTLLALSALFVARANPIRAFGTMLRDARKLDSPDAGFTVAAMAGAFGLALAGGPWIGDGRARATAQDVRGAAYLYAVACLIHVGGLAVALGAYSPI